METQTNDLLDIPAFLKRKPGQVPKQKKQKRATAYVEPKVAVASLTPTPIKILPCSPQMWAWMIRDKFEDLIDEGNVDRFFDILKEHKSTRGLLDLLKANFTEAKDEMMEAKSELAEYYEGVSDEAIAFRLKAYIGILSDIDAVVSNKKATRKTSVRAKTTKYVAKVKYKVADPDLKIESIDPAKVVGAKGLVTFNTKYRRLSFYVALEGGLDFIGTTVKNIDAEKSIAKAIRKPETYVSSFRDAPNPKRVNVLLRDSIKGKAWPVSGRLNEDTLLLKVF